MNITARNVKFGPSPSLRKAGTRTMPQRKSRYFAPIAKNAFIQKNLKKKTKIDDLQAILSKVMRISGVSIEDMREKSRKVITVTARQFYCWAAMEEKINRYDVWKSLREIGEYVNIDHSTVLHSHKLINNLIGLKQKGDVKVAMVNDLYASWNAAHI